MKILMPVLLLGLAVSVAACQERKTETTTNTTRSEQGSSSSTYGGSTSSSTTAGKAAMDVKVEDAFARAVPAGQPNSGIFLTLVNNSTTAQTLKSASSSVAGSVELHNHVDNNGVMEMRQVPQIDIPANGKTELKPGGYHIMLLGLKQDLKAGDSVPLKLTFADGSETDLTVPVKEVGM